MIETVLRRAVGRFMEKIEGDDGGWFSPFRRLFCTGLREFSEQSDRLKAPVEVILMPSEMLELILCR